MYKMPIFNKQVFILSCGGILGDRQRHILQKLPGGHMTLCRRATKLKTQERSLGGVIEVETGQQSAPRGSLEFTLADHVTLQEVKGPMSNIYRPENGIKHLYASF